ncbi:MAG: hypothetical protein ACREKH_21635 [Candidatus Rokuibacteriota bacterium]
MDDAARAQEMWRDLTGKNLELMTVWADANQRMLKEWAELAFGTAKEGLRLSGELQGKMLEGVRAMAEGAYGPQTACRLAEDNVQTLTRTAERMQATAEQAGKGIQTTLTDAVTRTKEIYGRAA